MDIIKQLTFAEEQYQAALTSGMGIDRAVGSLKNMLFNARQALIAAAQENAALREELEAANAALAEADAQIRSLERGSKAKKNEEDRRDA